MQEFPLYPDRHCEQFVCLSQPSTHTTLPLAWHSAIPASSSADRLQSGPQKPGEHCTLKLMVMVAMLWNPVNIISSVKLPPSWRLSRLTNKLSVMFGSPLSNTSIKNCIRPYENLNIKQSVVLCTPYRPFSNISFWNYKRVVSHIQDCSWTLTECCAHFTEWAGVWRQGTGSEEIWRVLSIEYTSRSCLQWCTEWSDGPTEPGVTSCISCIVTVARLVR